MRRERRFLLRHGTEHDNGRASGYRRGELAEQTSARNVLRVIVLRVAGVLSEAADHRKPGPCEGPAVTMTVRCVYLGVTMGAYRRIVLCRAMLKP